MKIPYTSVRGGNRFFEPRGRMVPAGFKGKPLGRDDEAAVSLARTYPRGSIGAAWRA